MEIIFAYLIIVITTAVLIVLTNFLTAKASTSGYAKLIMQVAGGWSALIVAVFFSMSLLPFLSNLLQFVKVEGVAQTVPQILTLFVGSALVLVYVFTQLNKTIAQIFGAKKTKASEVMNFFLTFFLLPGIILVGGVWYLTH